MGLESGTYVSDLTPSYPLSSDLRKQGDDHIRLIKSVLQATFPSANKPFYIPKSAAITTTYAVLTTDQNKVLICSSVGGAYTITLPNLGADDAGWSCELFKSTTDTNAINVTPTSGNINNVTFLQLRSQNDFVIAYWTGTEWYAEVNEKLGPLARTVTGTVDAIVVTMSPATPGWVTGETFEWISPGVNITTTPTIAKDGGAAKTIVAPDGTAIPAGATGISGVRNRGYYDGTNVRLLNYVPVAATVGSATINMASKNINMAKGASVTAAATTDIWTPADGNFRHITGTTGITSFGTAPQAGAWQMLEFDAATTITYNATTMRLNTGGANYTTAAGDMALVYADTTANMHVTIFKADGTSPVAPTTRTLLATLNTSSGTTWSATGLSPASYRYFECEVNNVSAASGTTVVLQVAVSGNGGANYGTAVPISASNNSAATAWNGLVQIYNINVATQIAPVVQTYVVQNTNGGTATTTNVVLKNATGGTGAVDALQFSLSSSTGDSGSIPIYGVK